MRMRSLAFILLAAAPATAFADAPKGPPPPAPEVKKTVDAFVGKWTFDGTLTGLPGAKGPAKVTDIFTCAKAAGGRVAQCTGKGKGEGVGDVEQLSMITYDEGNKVVRFVGMSSMGDVHDHSCHWKDDKTLACDPMSTTGADGQPVTVDFTVAFSDAKTAKMTEVETSKDGSKVTFEANGKRK